MIRGQLVEFALKNYSHFNDNEPIRIDCLTFLGNAHKAMKDEQKSIDCFEEALKAGRNLYGHQHALVSTLRYNLVHAKQTFKREKKIKGLNQTSQSKNSARPAKK